MIPHNAPTLGSAEIAAAADAISSGWVAQGPAVHKFEEGIAQSLGLARGGAVAFSSATAALFVALSQLKASESTVVLPTYGCSALRNAAVWAGANPKYVDCEPKSPNATIDAPALGDADIVVAVSTFGIPASIPSGSSIVVEDAAQALGSTVGGEAVGARTSVGILSFSATKMITSGGQGGAVVSNDSAFVEAVRDFREFDCRRDKGIRFNFQMTDVQAAIGEVQRGRLPEFLDRREEIFQFYKTAGIDLLEPKGPASLATTVARYRAVFLVEDQAAALRSLHEDGVSAIVPIEDYELLDTDGSYPHALHLAHHAVSLPIYPGLTGSQVTHVINAVKRFL